MPQVRPALHGPGVYVQEVPSADRTIVGVPTSVTVFLGRAAWGPVNTPTPIESFDDFEGKFGGLRPDCPVTYAVQDFFLNGGTQAVVVRLFKGDPDAARATVAVSVAPAAGPDPAVLARAAADVQAAQKALDAATDPAAKAQAKQALERAQAAQRALSAPTPAPRPPALTAASPGTWGARLTASMDRDGVNDHVVQRYATATWDARDLCNLTLRLGLDDGRELVERFTSVSPSAAAGARFLGHVLETGSRLARLDPAAPAAPRTGADSGPLDDGAYHVGLEALGRRVDVFNLVCLPPDTRDGDAPGGVLLEALGLCERRRATLLLDAPSAWTQPDDITPARFETDLGISPGDVRARCAAVYYPRVVRNDPFMGRTDVFPACGAVAGIIARTDQRRGVWKAPAGTEAGVSGVAGLERDLTDDEGGALNQIGVNCLRSFPGTGPVVWGARTLRGADALADDYKYLPVRRLADYIEETLVRSTQWAVFEPNDEPLWSQLRLSIGAFMTDLFRQGAFQGTSRDDAFFVRCDATTTPQADIDAGIVNVVIGFAPLKPSEFVILYLAQKAGPSRS